MTSSRDDLSAALARLDAHAGLSPAEREPMTATVIAAARALPAEDPPDRPPTAGEPVIEIVDSQPYGHDACPTITFDPAAGEHWCWKVHLHVPTGGGPSTLADAVAILRARLVPGEPEDGER